MFYIHKATCVSAQHTYPDADIGTLRPSVENKLQALHPNYEGIPPGVLRRMGKAVKLGVGAALPIIGEEKNLGGIVIGSSNGGMEDCVKFLVQIIEYAEGTLTPTNFVQSTANAIASQIAFMAHNKGYNITHVQRGLAFENAMIDASMLAREHPGTTYLLGGVDEISEYNYNIDFLRGRFKKEPVSNTELYGTHSVGTLAGEGAAMFTVNGSKQGAIGCVKDVRMLHTEDRGAVMEQLSSFITANLPAGEKVDLLLSGENGDVEQEAYYAMCEQTVNATAVARFKHMFGEYPTVMSAAVWLAVHLLAGNPLPLHMLKSGTLPQALKNILICNSYELRQHGFVLVRLP